MRPQRLLTGVLAMLFLSVAVHVCFAPPLPGSMEEIRPLVELLIRIADSDVQRVLSDEVALPHGVTVELLYRPDHRRVDSIDRVVWDGLSADQTTGERLVATFDEPGEHFLTFHVEGTRVVTNFFPSSSGKVREGSFRIQREVRFEILPVHINDVRAKVVFPGEGSQPPLDLDGDFRVDVRDLDAFWKAYGNNRGDAAYEPLADWDGDGAIGLRDLTRFIDSYETWEGRRIGPDYGNGLIFPVTARPGADDYSFGTPQPAFRAESDPPELASLIEWTVDGAGVGTGSVFTGPFESPGVYEVRAALPGHAEADSRQLTIYEAAITNMVSGEDFVRHGVEYTFLAETDPPGFEDYVNWFASTKYGSVSLERGRGPSFTVTFENMIGPYPGRDDIEFEWLGVQADNAYFNQVLLHRAVRAELHKRRRCSVVRNQSSNRGGRLQQVRFRRSMRHLRGILRLQVG